MKKYNYLNKSQKLLITAMTIPLAVSVLPAAENVHASNEIPNLIIYELNGSPKLEWATEILQENIIMSTGFENSELQPNFMIGNSGHAGKQSLVHMNGNTFIQLLDNIKNEGNYYYYPNTYSHLSAFNFDTKVNYIPNGTNLSISFKARTNGNSTFGQALEHPLGDLPLELTDELGNKVLFAESIDFRTSKPPLEIPVYSSGNNGIVKYSENTFKQITNSKGISRAFGSTLYKWNQSEQKFTLDNPEYSSFASPHTPSGNNPPQIPLLFNKGETLMTPEWINVTFQSRTIISDGEWHMYNLNAYLDHNNYNFDTHGFKTMFFQGTDGILDIDDITFGHATEVEVYRDGNSIYRGYLSDFHDNALQDNAKPNKVTNVNGLITNDFNINFNIVKPQDKGVKANYQIQSIAKNGNRSALSTPQEIEVKSGVVKYKYSISNQEIGLPMIETTSLDNLSIPLKSINLEKGYLHIQAIDGNGNASDVSSFKLNELIDMQDLYNKIKELEDSNNYNDFIDFIDEIENLYGDNLPQDLKEMIDKLGQHHGVNTSFLLLEEGDFRLSTSDINSFGHTKLTAKKQTLITSFKSDFGVIDARGTQEGWNVTVSATPFTVETFDAFIGTPHQLPVGSLTLNAINHVEQVGIVHNSQLPTISLNELTAIDGENQTVNLLNAEQQKGMGEFKFNFRPDALALTVDAVTAKIDTINYPDKNTPYASTVTWDLVSGPQL